jgi:hypothetical protein
VAAKGDSFVETSDSRHLNSGWLIHGDNYYVDEPIIIRTDDGAWLCTLSVGDDQEGVDSGQHSIARRSTDRGRSWSDPVYIEPPMPPEGSKVSLVKVPGGRIYAVYTRNSDNLREVLADDGSTFRRVDSLGYFVFKYTDDGGRTWSQDRQVVDVREMEIDRRNPYKGKVRFFWNSARSFVHEGCAYVPLTKVGGFGEGTFTSSEGVLLKSSNMLTERDPAAIRWETLPRGDAGLRAPGGPIAEEHSYSVLSDGSFFCVYRTTDGHPAVTYSRDRGYTWSAPQYMRFAGGRLVKHPRAANFAWKCANGKYLYWFHNHGGRFIAGRGSHYPYEDRNPVWLSGGIERDSPQGKVIAWSQPEIGLYDDDPFVRISYPDLIEEGGEVFLTEANKAMARVHHIDRGLLEGLWGQFDAPRSTRAGIILERGGGDFHGTVDMPALPAFAMRDPRRRDYGTLQTRRGFTIEILLSLDDVGTEGVILDSRDGQGRGLCVASTHRGTVELQMCDGRTLNRWDCDPGLLRSGHLHHIVILVDGGPRIITFVVDGVLCDGGDYRQFGWGRFSPNLKDANGAGLLHVGTGLRGALRLLRLYDCCLRTSEAVGNFGTLPPS